MNEPLLRDNPYAAPVAHLAEAPAAEGLVQAERGTRLGAALLDGLMFALCYIPFVIGLALATPQSGQVNDTPMFIGTGAMLVGMLALMGFNCVLLYRNGQTIAKRWLGIRVVRADGSRAGLARIIFARILPTGLLGAIPLIGPIISLTDALLIFRDDRRCLHDQIADTIVVRA